VYTYDYLYGSWYMIVCMYV